jgi:hypothetical protein
MSFDHILNKLAEKKAAEGNTEFAYRLIVAAEKHEKECAFCGETKAKMMKRKSKNVCEDCATMKTCALKECGAKMMKGEMYKKGEKHYCCADCAKKDSLVKKSALDEMLSKYAGIEDLKKWQETHGKGKNSNEKKTSKDSFKAKIKEMDGFCGMEGGGFGFDTMAQAKKALAVAEQASNFLNWKISKETDCFVLNSHGMDKKSFVDAGSLLKKYAQDYKGDPGFEHEMEDYKMEKGFLGNDLDQDDFVENEMGNDNFPSSENQAPAWLKHEFEEWLRDDHFPLHPDDDREELWENFMMEKFGDK